MARTTRTTPERTSTAVASTTHEEGPGAMYGARDISKACGRLDASWGMLSGVREGNIWTH
jgi:hypothetical protein